MPFNRRMYFAISVTLGMPVPLNLGFLLLLKTETVILDLVSPYCGAVKRACVSGHAFVNSDAHLIHCYVCVFAYNKKTITGVGKDAKKLETSYIADGNAK